MLKNASAYSQVKYYNQHRQCVNALDLVQPRNNVIFCKKNDSIGNSMTAQQRLTYFWGVAQQKIILVFSVKLLLLTKVISVSLQNCCVI